MSWKRVLKMKQLFWSFINRSQWISWSVTVNVSYWETLNTRGRSQDESHLITDSLLVRASEIIINTSDILLPLFHWLLTSNTNLYWKPWCLTLWASGWTLTTREASGQSTVGRDHLAGFSEQQDTVWWRDVKLQPLRSTDAQTNI